MAIVLNDSPVGHMATDRYIECTARKCGNREWPGGLFQSLRKFRQSTTLCSKCGAEANLWLEFSFGNGRYAHLCKVLDVFLPEGRPLTWREGRYRRGFYPFLVMVESTEEEGVHLRKPHRSAWLPYWHIDRNRRGRIVHTKYGQWAPFMAHTAFASLVRQARKKGYRI